MKPTIVVVDDDPGVRYTLRQILEDAEMEVREETNGESALAWLEKNHADLVICDLQMPRMDGIELLRRLGQIPSAAKAVLVTAHGSERHAVQAMKLGALDYFSKPFDVDEILEVVKRAVGAILRERENEELKAQLSLSCHLVFRSEAMRKVALLVHRVAPRDVTVLLSGPSGTGKERIADAIVAASARAEKPFVRFNCAALPEELAEAELFGHTRGAFTGAAKTREGLFRKAEGGSILLDEIGELGPATQGKLLRVLQEKAIRPVGEDLEVPVDVRLLAATNRDLRKEVEAGRFREDLYYRLKVVEIYVPPLDERPEDVPVLVDHFIQLYARRFGIGNVTASPAVRQRLGAGPFPGNVRELKHRVERLVALSVDGILEEEHLGGAPPEEELGLRERVEAFERGLIVDQLERCGGNRTHTAARLGIGRVTLLEKMKKYGIR